MQNKFLILTRCSHDIIVVFAFMIKNIQRFSRMNYSLHEETST